MKIKKKKEQERDTLCMYEETCNRALNEFSLKYPDLLSVEKKNKINSVLERMFIAEREYLFENPESYFYFYENEGELISYIQTLTSNK